jgi:undecaprenyl-diphosphatase
VREAVLADFIARHAIPILVAAAGLLLSLTAAFWHLVRATGPRAWPLAVKLWNGFRAGPFGRWLRRTPLVGPLFARALTAGRYLGLYAVCAFAVTVGAVAAFVEVADEIGFNEDLARFDVALAAGLARHLGAETLRAFALITHLGDRDVLVAIGALVLVILLAARRWMLAGAWLAATAGGAAMNLVLKAWFQRQRPLHEHGFALETGWSFPSGHASGSMLVYSLLGYLLVRHTARAWHLPIAVATVALIVFVGSSRILLQVHWFSDVLAGFASAAAWSALWIAALETVRWRERTAGRAGYRSP